MLASPPPGALSSLHDDRRGEGTERLASVRSRLTAWVAGPWALLGCLCASLAIAATAQAMPFGIAGFAMRTTRAVPAGVGVPGPGFVNEPYSFTQAGGHPDALTSIVEFAGEESGSNHSVKPAGEAKDMALDLPPGLLANPLAVPLCPQSVALSGTQCPVDSQVGVFVIHMLGDRADFGPIVDLTPQAGQAAAMGLETKLGTFLLTGRLERTSQGYGLRIAANDLTKLQVSSVETTLWGVPAATEHDPERGLFCTASEATQPWTCEGGGASSGVYPVPFLTMPDDCSAGQQTGDAWADSWEAEGQYVRAQSSMPAVTGCNLLTFAPEIEVAPLTSLADEPVGIDMNVSVGQAESSEALAAPQLRNVSITLPPGLSISAAVANGVQACQRSGAEGIDIPTGTSTSGQPLSPAEVGEGEEAAAGGEKRLAPGHCPEASVVGSAEAFTPLIAAPIKGRVYLAAPGCAGSGQAQCTDQDAADGNLYRLYVELSGAEGIDVKIEGKVQVSPVTGQITMRLTETPQLPLSRLNVDLNGGPHALLDNPSTCGQATTTSDLQLWSASGTTPAPESLSVAGTPDGTPSSSYTVTGCPSSPVFSPRVTAATTTPWAGSFGALTLTVSRSDREEYLSNLRLTTPAGLSAVLSSVPPCEAAAANAGTCPQASRIGSAVVAAGAGSQPFEMLGNIYLTTGYEGSPFGLSIVANADVGPLDLGLIVIRARVDIDPASAALTITSDPLPQIVFGVPLRAQKVTLSIDRTGFMVNPTSCGEEPVNATISGSLGTVAHVSTPIAIAGCKALLFKPTVAVSTAAHTSYASGASLDMKLKFPSLPQGAAANLAKIEIALPKQLSTRLTTLQGACPQATFTANPAACSSASIVGVATVSTPLLAGTLSGPVYLVSHGLSAFPSPAVVLEGPNGVRLDLAGGTIVGGAGSTSVAFDSIPDVPIASFQLKLPEGPHSMLGANSALCVTAKTTSRRRGARRPTSRPAKSGRHSQVSLISPIELVAQNGLIVRQDAKVTVTGCTRGRRKTASARHVHGSAKNNRRKKSKVAPSKKSKPGGAHGKSTK